MKTTEASQDKNKLLSGEPLVELRNLSLEFHSRKKVAKAVNDISLEVYRAETVAILGESGSGKSATALAIMGLLPKPGGVISGGEILFEGKDLVKLSEAERRKLYGESLSIIFQDPLSALNPVLTVGYQIGEALRKRKNLSKKETEKRVIELMKLVRIPDAENRYKQYPYQFSGGMQQRVMIALALAMDPKLLIADEPTTALDVTVQAQIMRLLKDLQNRNHMGLILISHDLGVVAENADRVAVMYAGHIVETGEVETIFRNPAHPYTVGLMASIPSSTQNGERLKSIEGLPPNLADPPTGCAFHPRCFMATELCRQKEPVLLEILPGRKSACHFAEDVLNDESI
ncbi:ABC transporter ATP-binding protein [Fictibacillus sp. 18YEL24]|uniref:ABC transporter ATP-binding protein n=1 Tax=Fictibacillus sp. 18YEL24 TaxID=2745875 RepID=UPI0018CFAE92|nr:ABC transporter ATP-binding protein [Fictibacillus sp. 18YEL24]MBH0169158.1 ABC transporter ATP-binding protein [Fictibacillus sp. 18YEL24]